VILENINVRAVGGSSTIDAQEDPVEEVGFLLGHTLAQGDLADLGDTRVLPGVEVDALTILSRVDGEIGNRASLETGSLVKVASGWVYYMEPKIRLRCESAVSADSPWLSPGTRLYHRPQHLGAAHFEPT
jgi:hypothetical protein